MARTYRKTNTTDKRASKDKRSTNDKRSTKASRTNGLSSTSATIVPKKKATDGSVRRQKKEDATNDVAMSVSWAKGDRW
jgi:hypothetical protein